MPSLDINCQLSSLFELCRLIKFLQGGDLLTISDSSSDYFIDLQEVLKTRV